MHKNHLINPFCPYFNPLKPIIYVILDNWSSFSSSSPQKVEGMCSNKGIEYVFNKEEVLIDLK